MKQTLISLIIICLIITSCSKKKEILYAEYINDGLIEKTECRFHMYSDSTYEFTLHEFMEYQHEKNEIFRGRSFMKADSVVFFPFDLKFLYADRAILKNGYLEFLKADFPFKMKIVKTSLKQKFYVDSSRFKDYFFFTYDSTFYRCFQGDFTPYDLDNNDLSKIDSILISCIQENRSSLTNDLKDYVKQVVAVKNSDGEVLVWINLLCDKGMRKDSFYSIIHVNDGGDCFFNLKINLRHLNYYDLYINGLA